MPKSTDLDKKTKKSSILKGNQFPDGYKHNKPVRNDNVPVMRASTTMERVGDRMRDGYEAIANQPAAKLADMLGLSDFEGVVKSFTTPDDGIRMGIMPGPPGGKVFGKGRNFYESWFNKNRYLDKEKNRILAGQHKNPANQIHVESGRPFPSNDPLPDWVQSVKKMPAAPNEFHMASEVDDLIRGMGGAPQGSMQILDESARPLLNASGESMASAEAMSRMRGMKDRGQKYVVRKGGTTRELIGPEAVDYNVRPGEQYGILDADGLFKLLQGR